MAIDTTLAAARVKLDIVSFVDTNYSKIRDGQIEETPFSFSRLPRDMREKEFYITQAFRNDSKRREEDPEQLRLGLFGVTLRG
jgi:hypothetical protein